MKRVTTMGNRDTASIHNIVGMEEGSAGKPDKKIWSILHGVGDFLDINKVYVEKDTVVIETLTKPKTLKADYIMVNPTNRPEPTPEPQLSEKELEDMRRLGMRGTFAERAEAKAKIWEQQQRQLRVLEKKKSKASPPKSPRKKKKSTKNKRRRRRRITKGK
tara:strand:- start:719 stop:1201 length:483 start_codon:yes stop_codon:yes gene_type:complete